LYGRAFGQNNCFSVIEVEGEDAIDSPGHTEGEGVRGEGEVEGNSRSRDMRGLEQGQISWCVFRAIGRSRIHRYQDCSFEYTHTRAGGKEGEAIHRGAGEQRGAGIVRNCQATNSNLAQLLEEKVL
jgi:hypothetical protein